MTTKDKQAKKPIQLRIIFILNALMMFLPFLVYFLVTNNKIEMDVVPMHVIYTGIAYIISFGALVYCILNKKFFAFRTMFFINLLIALPVGVDGGIVVVIVSFVLSHTKQVKSFFNASKLS